MVDMVHSGLTASIPGGSVAGHTPGPWKVFTVKDGPNKGQLLGVGEENGAGVADAHGGLWGSGAEKMANARLIAAAPDLLAFASALDADWTREFPDGPDTVGVGFRLADETVALWRQARAAIAKATAGETRNAEGAL